MGEVLTGRRTVDGTRDAARPGLCAGERGTRLFGLIAGPDGPTNRARVHGRRSRQLSRMDKCQRRSGLTAAQAASVLHLTGPKVTKPFDANIDEFTLDELQPAIWLAREKQIREELDDSAPGNAGGPTTCGWSPMFGCWPMTTSAASRDFETLSVPRPSGRVQSSQLLYEDARYTSVWERWWYPVRHAISQPARRRHQGKELRRRVRTTAEAVGVAMPSLFGRYPSPPDWERVPIRVDFGGDPQ